MKFCINKNGVLYKELLALNNGNVGLATDAHTTIDYLQDKKLMSLHRTSVRGKMEYTIPMQNYTTKQIPGQLKGDYSKIKNHEAFQELEKVLIEQDIDWIKVQETENTFMITLEPNNIQDKLQRNLNESYDITQEQAESLFYSKLNEEGKDGITQFCKI